MLTEPVKIIWVAEMTDLESAKLAAKFNKVKKRLEALQLLKLPGVHVWESDDGPGGYATLQYALRYAQESGGRLLQLNTHDTVQITEENIAYQGGSGKYALLCD